MKKATRLLSLVLVLILCLSVLPMGALAVQNGWVKGDYGKWFYYENGEMVTGWKKISGKWYFFRQYSGDGLRYKGEMLHNESIEQKEGSDTITYLFGSDGAMVTNKWWGYTVYYVEGGTGYDWRYQLSNGKGALGWNKIGGVWYYFDEYGTMVTGFQEIDGKYYYFKDSGGLYTGWKKVPFSDEEGNEWESWMYFTSNGAVESGWKKISGKWYYFSGFEMVSDDWIEDANGDWYYLGKDGAMVTSKWVQDGGDWYYQLSSGKSAMGWLKLGGVWYYFDPGDYGAMVTGGPLWIDGNYYFFKSSGALYIGWKSIDGDWWYFTSNGAVKNGWKQIGGKWYQFADYICLNP